MASEFFKKVSEIYREDDELDNSIANELKCFIAVLTIIFLFKQILKAMPSAYWS